MSSTLRVLEEAFDGLMLDDVDEPIDDERKLKIPAT
jgi:hypothetical protein